MTDSGYAGKIAVIDLDRGELHKRFTADYGRRFIGGRGLAAGLYWDLVPHDARALSAQNCLIFASGPTAGFKGVAGNRFQVCAKMPSHPLEAFSNANMGGRWGTALKYAGFDALAVQGAASKPVYLFIHDEAIEIRDAADLWGRSTFDTMQQLKHELGAECSVLAIGPAGEHRVSFATMLADEGASGSSGLGAVMGAKNLKAVVTAGDQKMKAADPQTLQRLIDHILQLRPPAHSRPSPWSIQGLTFADDCWECGIGCSRQMYSGKDGGRYKTFCQASHVYSKPSFDFHGKWNETELLAIRLCDGYGLDTAVMQPLIGWLLDCHRQHLLSEQQTGLPFARAGSAEFIETLSRRIACREGFGDLLAQGLAATAESLGAEARKLLDAHISTRANETKDYDPRLLITTALFYATSTRRPINELHGVSTPVLVWMNTMRNRPGAFFTTDDFREAAARFWGSAQAADFSTLEAKAAAAKIIQDRTMAKESLVLCDMVWPMMWVDWPGGHVGDPTLESQIYSAITGNPLDEAGLCACGERIFNLQRAIQLRHGWAGRADDRLMDYMHDRPLQKGEIFFNAEALLPGRNGEIISKLGAVLTRAEFAQLKDEYYGLRGWDKASGLPTRCKLNELQLADIADDLARRGLAK